MIAGWLPHAVSQSGIGSSNERDYCYDAAGNMVRRNGAPISYDALGRVREMGRSTWTHTTLRYGPGENRVERTSYDQTGDLTAHTVYVGEGRGSGLSSCVRFTA